MFSSAARNALKLRINRGTSIIKPQCSTKTPARQFSSSASSFAQLIDTDEADVFDETSANSSNTTTFIQNTSGDLRRNEFWKKLDSESITGYSSTLPLVKENLHHIRSAGDYATAIKAVSNSKVEAHFERSEIIGVLEELQTRLREYSPDNYIKAYGALIQAFGNVKAYEAAYKSYLECLQIEAAGNNNHNSGDGKGDDNIGIRSSVDVSNSLDSGGVFDSSTMTSSNTDSSRSSISIYSQEDGNFAGGNSTFKLPQNPHNTTSLHNIMLKVCSKSGNLKLAQEIFVNMGRSKTIISYNTMLDCCVRAGLKQDLVLRLFQSCPFPPTSITYNTVIQACDFSKAIQILGEMRVKDLLNRNNKTSSSKPLIDTIVVNSVLASLNRSTEIKFQDPKAILPSSTAESSSKSTETDPLVSKTECALSLLKIATDYLNLRPSIVTYNNVLACCRDNPTVCVDIFTTKVKASSKFKPDPQYSKQVNPHSKKFMINNKVIAVNNLMASFLNIDLDSSSTSTIVDFLKSDLHNCSSSTQNSANSDNTSSLDVLIPQWIQAVMLNNNKRKINNMASNETTSYYEKIRPNLNSYSIAIGLCQVVHDPGSAFTLWKNMMKAFEPDILCYNSILRACIPPSNNALNQDITKMSNRCSTNEQKGIISSKTINKNTLITEKYKKIISEKTILELLGKARRLKDSDATTYRAAITALVRLGYSETALKVFEAGAKDTKLQYRYAQVPTTATNLLGHRDDFKWSTDNSNLSCSRADKELLEAYVDLHGFPVELARIALNNAIQTTEALNIKHLTVIVGRGIHSPDVKEGEEHTLLKLINEDLTSTNFKCEQLKFQNTSDFNGRVLIHLS